MLRNFTGHDRPVAYSKDHAVFAIMDDPIANIEPLELAGGEAERDAALKAIVWILQGIGSTAIVAKVLALRYLLHMESRPMEVVSREHGICRATISNWVTIIADSLEVPALKSAQARKIYSDVQRTVWKKRRRENKPRGGS